MTPPLTTPNLPQGAIYRIPTLRSQGHGASHTFASSQLTLPFLLVAVPSAARLARLEQILGYEWINKEFLRVAVMRIVHRAGEEDDLLEGGAGSGQGGVPEDPRWEDDRMVYVKEEEREVLMLEQFRMVGQAVFGCEYWRLGVKRGGWLALLNPFPAQVLDNVLPCNKAIAGAAMLDGGWDAVSKVIPNFYRTISTSGPGAHDGFPIPTPAPSNAPADGIPSTRDARRETSPPIDPKLLDAPFVTQHASEAKMAIAQEVTQTVAEEGAHTGDTTEEEEEDVVSPGRARFRSSEAPGKYWMPQHYLGTPVGKREKVEENAEDVAARGSPVPRSGRCLRSKKV